MKKGVIKKDKKTILSNVDSSLLFIIQISSSIVVLFIVFLFFPNQKNNSFLKISIGDNTLVAQFQIAKQDRRDFANLTKNLNIKPDSKINLKIGPNSNLSQNLVGERYIWLNFSKNRLNWKFDKKISTAENIKLWDYWYLLPQNTLFYYQSRQVIEFIDLLTNWPDEFNVWLFELFQGKETAFIILDSNTPEFEYLIISKIQDKKETDFKMAKIFQTIDTIKQKQNDKLSSVKVIGKDNQKIYSLVVSHNLSAKNNYSQFNQVATTLDDLLIIASSENALDKITNSIKNPLPQPEKPKLPNYGQKAIYLQQPAKLLTKTLPFNNLSLGPAIGNLKDKLEVVQSFYMVETVLNYQGYLNLNK